MKLHLAGIAALTLVAGGLLGSPAAAAATTEEVTESDVTRAAENTPPVDDWMLYTRAGTPPTAGAFADGPAILGDGSLKLSTATSSEKVFLFNYEHIGTDLGDVDDISYYTFREAGSAQQVAGLNLQVDYNGAAAGGFTTLVFEPVYNTAQGAVVTGSWQDWIADGSGRWWSTQPINGQCGGAAVACFRTWDFIVANNPDAVITGGVGVNQGSGNAGLISNVDALTFDETTYDFEADADSDGVGNGSDNCPTTANPGQNDTDNDGEGDACDADDDNDGVNDDDDDFPFDPTETTDTDSDGVGDNTDNCVDTANSGQNDTDDDGEGDACDADDDNDGVNDDDDAFPFDPDETADADEDGIGDNEDTDDDNDGIPDTSDTNSKEDCKNGGYANFTSPTFKNQGACVSYFAMMQ